MGLNCKGPKQLKPVLLKDQLYFELQIFKIWWRFVFSLVTYRTHMTLSIWILAHYSDIFATWPSSENACWPGVRG